MAKEGDDVLETTVTGSVDENTVGVYSIVYSATNSDGYDGSGLSLDWDKITIRNPEKDTVRAEGSTSRINFPTNT